MVEQMSSSREATWRSRIACIYGAAAERRAFTYWTIAWAVAFVGATWLLVSDIEFTSGVRWTLAVGPTLIGLVAVGAYVQFLRRADEMVRKIQLEGVAIGFGAGVIFSVGYQLLERAGAPELGIGDSVVVMMFAWAIGQIVAASRYT